MSLDSHPPRFRPGTWTVFGWVLPSERRRILRAVTQDLKSYAGARDDRRPYRGLRRTTKKTARLTVLGRAERRHVDFMVDAVTDYPLIQLVGLPEDRPPTPPLTPTSAASAWGLTPSPAS